MHLALILDGLQNGINIRLEDHAAHDNLIQHIVDAVGMKDQIQFTNILKTLSKASTKT